jgi:DNA-binding beta-propeller fold protein YncE
MPRSLVFTLVLIGALCVTSASSFAQTPTWLASLGYRVGGPFNQPYGMASDGHGNLYIADTGNHCIRECTSTGAFVRTWGTHGTAAGEFEYPRGVAVDGAGNVYVTDTNHSRIEVFDASGTFLRQWGGFGTTNGRFGHPWGIALGPDGNLYVADTDNARVQVFATDGTYLRQWHGSMLEPACLTVDASGSVCVADPAAGANAVWVTSPTGALISRWGWNPGSTGLSVPTGVALDHLGHGYVVDMGEHVVKVFTLTGAYLFSFGSFGQGDGQFDTPAAVTVDADGTVYVADLLNNRIEVFSNAWAVPTHATTWGRLKAQYR